MAQAGQSGASVGRVYRLSPRCLQGSQRMLINGQLRVWQLTEFKTWIGPGRIFNIFKYAHKSKICLFAIKNVKCVAIFPPLAMTWIWKRFHMNWLWQMLLFIDLRGRKGEGGRKFIGWLRLVCALTWDQTCNLGVLVRCSNQQSYWARAILSNGFKHLSDQLRL